MNFLECNCRLVGAWFALAQGQEARALDALRRALGIAAKQDFRNFLRWNPKMMSRLCAFALENDIEPDYTRRLIALRGLMPPVNAGARLRAWPWPIRIRTLGLFDVQVENGDTPVIRNSQRKPLELLQALIALGSNEVPVTRIIDELWPGGKDGVNKDKAFEIALYRLRGLLGVSDAILLQNNRLSLNPAVTWMDIREFESLVNETSPDKNRTDRLFDLYQGPFLAQEPDEPWIWPLRERLRARLLRYCMQAGDIFVAQGKHTDAIALFERGIDVDPLAEEFYVALMRAHEILGRHTEALSVYRRCEKTLGSALGVRPSRETEAVHQRLRGRAATH